MLYPIFGLIGPHGAGKSTLIIEALVHLASVKILTSITTRPERDSFDPYIYNFIPVCEFQEKIERGDFIQWVMHPTDGVDHYYGNDRQMCEAILESHYGIIAITEDGYHNFTEAGYTVYPIKIIPVQKPDVPHDLSRIVADAAREKIDVPYELTIINSFGKRGLVTSVGILISFVKSHSAM